MSDMNINRLSIPSGKEALKPIEPTATCLPDLTSANKKNDFSIQDRVVFTERCNPLDNIRGSADIAVNSFKVVTKPIMVEKAVAKKQKKKKKKKNQCYFSDCKHTFVRYIGDCNFCRGHFCSKHRILENHLCEGLQSCKDEMHKRNADKLAKEQTEAPKIQI